MKEYKCLSEIYSAGDSDNGADRADRNNAPKGCASTEETVWLDLCKLERYKDSGKEKRRGDDDCKIDKEEHTHVVEVRHTFLGKFESACRKF